MTTADTLRNFITGELAGGRAASEVGDQLPLIEERVIDSLGIVRLVAFIESEFGVQIGDEELLIENFDTIASITRLIEAKRAA
jgi:acyl carrier protein